MSHNSPACVAIAGAGGIGGKLLERLVTDRTWRGMPVDTAIVIDFLPQAERRDALAQQLAAAFPGEGRSAVFHWNAAEMASTEALAEQLQRFLGGRPIDALLVTTGMGFHGNVAALPLRRSNDVLQRMLQINCTGPAMLMQLVGTKHMRSADDSAARGCPPTILVMSSYSGLIGLPDRAAYCASKFALNGWAEGLYADMQHLRIVLICPTTVETGFRDNWKKQLGGGADGSSPSSSSAPTGAPLAPTSHPLVQATREAGTAVMKSLGFDGKKVLSVPECVDGVWDAFSDRKASSGVQYVVMKGFWTDVAAWGSRTWFMGDFMRRRVMAKMADTDGDAAAPQSKL
jgi:NAD(P)-dependent dehydrogenase (short-subunit alcohol dehydrogenase family)